MLTRLAIFAYGCFAYVLFFTTFLYAVGFVGGFVVPRSIDSGPTLPVWQALLVNALLLTIFAVQHSVMARRGFKQWLTRYIPRSAERSTYVLASSAALLLLFWQWQPIGMVIWNVTHPVGVAVLLGLFAAGWLTVLITTFLINHFDLFGLRQVWFALRGEPYRPLPFTTPGPYRHVRHPLYVGWLLAFWATPTMTAAHFFFALMTTAYILVAIQLEERDLVVAHREYAGYRERVPMLVPGLARAAGWLRRRTPQPVTERI